MICQEILDLVISQHVPNSKGMLQIQVFSSYMYIYKTISFVFLSYSYVYYELLYFLLFQNVRKNDFVQKYIDLLEYYGINYQWFEGRSKSR